MSALITSLSIIKKCLKQCFWVKTVVFLLFHQTAVPWGRMVYLFAKSQLRGGGRGYSLNGWKPPLGFSKSFLAIVVIMMTNTIVMIMIVKYWMGVLFIAQKIVKRLLNMYHEIKAYSKRSVYSAIKRRQFTLFIASKKWLMHSDILFRWASISCFEVVGNSPKPVLLLRHAQGTPPFF